MSYKCPNCDRTSEQPENCPTCNVPMTEVVAETTPVEAQPAPATEQPVVEATPEAAQPSETPTPEVQQ